MITLFCKYGTQKGEWKSYFKDDKYLFDVDDYEKKLAFERDFIKILLCSKAFILYCVICTATNGPTGYIYPLFIKSAK